MEIVLDTQDLCWDFGTIVRIIDVDDNNEIKVTRPDGFTYYIGTPDVLSWDILDGFSESDLPLDWKPAGYYYINSEWIPNVDPSPTGMTYNDLTGSTENV